MVLGHEVVGRVRTGGGRRRGPSGGDPGGRAPGLTGRRRRHPLSRRPAQPVTLGTYLGSAARLPHTDGAFVRHVTLATRMLRPLPAPSS